MSFDDTKRLVKTVYWSSVAIVMASAAAVVFSGFVVYSTSQRLEEIERTRFTKEDGESQNKLLRDNQEAILENRRRNSEILERVRLLERFQKDSESSSESHLLRSVR